MIIQEESRSFNNYGILRKMAKNAIFNKNRVRGCILRLAAHSKMKEPLRFIIHELYNRSGNDNRDDCAYAELSAKQNAHCNHDGIQHYADCFHLPAVPFG